MDVLPSKHVHGPWLKHTLTHPLGIRIRDAPDNGALDYIYSELLCLSVKFEFQENEQILRFLLNGR